MSKKDMEVVVKSKRGKIVQYRDRDNEWRWMAIARNGRILAVSSEGYKRKAAMHKAIVAVMLILIDGKALR